MADRPVALGPRLPAEWEPQWATLLCWPGDASAWRPVLRYARQSWRELVDAIRRFQPVILIDPDGDLLAGEWFAPHPRLHPVTIAHCPCDDTWVRDWGPLTILDGGHARWLDFRFDGWGGRCRRPLADTLAASLALNPEFRHLTVERVDWVFEGGAVDGDGRGTLLAATRHLRHRHPGFRKDSVERRLSLHLGARRVLWLDHGELLGDRCDGPVDTLARFADAETIVYQGCARPGNPHAPFLAAMAAQLTSFRTIAGGRYRLLDLPLPHTMGHRECRVPASYASFLILNRAVLMPTYRDPDNDDRAAAVLAQAFPSREIVRFDCGVLITQGRGLHGAALQLPAAAQRATAGTAAMPEPAGSTTRHSG